MIDHLTSLIRKEMCPALGVTEPAAIALACAKACSLSKEKPERVHVQVNPGIYKNAFTCGIPNTAKVGNEYAAALGALAGDAQKELFVLEGIDSKDIEASEQMIADGRIQVEVDSTESALFIHSQVITKNDVCEAEIRYSHTNICYLSVNQRVLLDTRDAMQQQLEESEAICSYTLADFYSFATNVQPEALNFIQDAHAMNYALAKAGLESSDCAFTRELLLRNGGEYISQDAEKTATLLTAAAVEARVKGFNHPAMSIVGSGNHGIISTLPLYAVAKIEGYSQTALLRATVLGYLITMYIKKYSGKLSAFCGCAVASGTGMACALAMLRGGSLMHIENTLYNMANSITGMICQGGNLGCVMKVISAIKTGFSAAELGLAGVNIAWVHGIGGVDAQQTMKNIGRIADPGMIETDKVILEILSQKASDILKDTIQ